MFRSGCNFDSPLLSGLRLPRRSPSPHLASRQPSQKFLVGRSVGRADPEVEALPGRVRAAVALIQRKTSAPSVSCFAPTLNPAPPLMLGAWPPSPPRLLPPGPLRLPKRPQRRMLGSSSWPSPPPLLPPPRVSSPRTPLVDNTNYSRFRRTSLTTSNYRTPHFCLLLKE
ncbi:hypothetical protein MSAN_00344500 [Mycena sanguinolenta]|uniref:Uncharacterized protein n=1 Tax=Mycena sanguinolenta TaxID=230812 RepID=A0A8H6ZC77_9AGAR|nr:hypothetical protein MSAN_00344500 [Mycena sanguinolenta]